MKTKTKIFAGIAAVAIILSTTGAVFADNGDYFGQGPDMGENQPQRQGRGEVSDQNVLMDDYMTSAMAEVFGLTVDEVERHLEAGESLITIALSQGYVVEDFDTLMGDIHSTASDLAAADGLILGEQQMYKFTNDWNIRARGNNIGGAEDAPRLNMNEYTTDCDSSCETLLYEFAEGNNSFRHGSRN